MAVPWLQELTAPQEAHAAGYTQALRARAHAPAPALPK